MIRRRNERRYLREAPVLIVDQKFDSQYFQVSDFPTTLHAGKNMFRIEGNSALLEKGSRIEIEVMPKFDSQPIFHMVNDYTDDAGRKIISIWVYPEQGSGAATVTITGVAKRRPGRRLVPNNWRNRRNVKWERTVYVDPSKKNTTPIIFQHQPRLTIDEHVKPFLSESFGSITPVVELNGVDNPGTLTYTYTPSQTFPGGGTATRGPGAGGGGYGYSIPSSTTITSTGIEFSASMVGGEVRIKNPTAFATPGLPAGGGTIPALRSNGNVNSTDYTASILQVINNNTIKISPQYSYQYNYTIGGTANRNGLTTPPQNVSSIYTPTSFTITDYSMSYQAEPQNVTINNFNYTSYANIILANIDPMVGDVYRVKVWMRSHGIQTWDLLAEELIEARELFSDPDNIVEIKRMGEFANQSHINSFWNVQTVTSIGSPESPELKADSEALMQGMLISGSKALRASSTRDTDYVKAYAKKPIKVYRDNEYTVLFKARAYAETDDNRKYNDTGGPDLRVYISGSGVDYGPVGNPFLGRRVDSGQLNAPAPTNPNPSIPMGNPATWAQYPAAPMAQMGRNSMASVTAQATPITSFNIPDIGANAAPMFDSDYISFDFKADHDGEIVPVFQVKFGKWVVSDIQIRSSIESGFTPNHTILEARVPQYQEDDILDFKFEFFDYNGVRSDLIIVSESISFEGGNTYINGEGYLGEGIIFDGEISG